MEREADKGRKMNFSHSHLNRLWYDGCHHHRQLFKISIIIYILIKFYIIVNMWYQNLKLDKRYLKDKKSYSYPWNRKHRSPTSSIYCESQGVRREGVERSGV